MALIECSECGGQVSDKAASCPHCGAPVKAETSVNNNWKLYEMLCSNIQHQHFRWVDNYKVFLSFNAFLLPAVTVLLGYSIKESEDALRPFVFLLCIIASFITLQGINLLKRIQIVHKMRFNQLNRLENSFPDLILKPFCEGKEFFFGTTDLPGLLQADFSKKGTPALNTYKKSSYAIIFYYILISFFSVSPWLLKLWNSIICLIVSS